MNRRNLLMASVGSAATLSNYQAFAGTPKAVQETTVRKVHRLLARNEPIDVLSALEQSPPLGLLEETSPELQTIPWDAPIDNFLFHATGFVLYADADGPGTSPEAASHSAGSIVICDSSDIAYELMTTNPLVDNPDLEIEYTLEMGLNVIHVSTDDVRLSFARINYALIGIVDDRVAPNALIHHLGLVLEQM